MNLLRLGQRGKAFHLDSRCQELSQSSATLAQASCKSLGWIHEAAESLGNILVGGLEQFLFSISYMGCHPSHWLSYFSEG